MKLKIHFPLEQRYFTVIVTNKTNPWGILRGGMPTDKRTKKFLAGLRSPDKKRPSVRLKTRKTGRRGHSVRISSVRPRMAKMSG
jgi:hypothetical protein